MSFLVQNCVKKHKLKKTKYEKHNKTLNIKEVLNNHLKSRN